MTNVPPLDSSSCAYGPHPSAFDGPWVAPVYDPLPPIDVGTPIVVRTIDPELAVLQNCYAQLRTLTHEQRLRVIEWLKSRTLSDYMDAQKCGGGDLCQK